MKFKVLPRHSREGNSRNSIKGDGKELGLPRDSQNGRIGRPGFQKGALGSLGSRGVPKGNNMGNLAELNLRVDK